MPTIKLTQIAVERLRPIDGRETTFNDNQLPGFGVRVSPRGRKTWVARYRIAGREIMQSLGTTAAIPISGTCASWGARRCARPRLGSIRGPSVGPLRRRQWQRKRS
jgi:hypothetical protein